MKDVLDPHPITRILPPVAAIAGAAYGFACILVAFGGGRLPVLGWEVEGGILLGLLWLVLIAPVGVFVTFQGSLYLSLWLDPFFHRATDLFPRRRNLLTPYDEARKDLRAREADVVPDRPVSERVSSGTEREQADEDPDTVPKAREGMEETVSDLEAEARDLEQRMERLLHELEGDEEPPPPDP